MNVVIIGAGNLGIVCAARMAAKGIAVTPCSRARPRSGRMLRTLEDVKDVARNVPIEP